MLQLTRDKDVLAHVKRSRAGAAQRIVASFEAPACLLLEAKSPLVDKLVKDPEFPLIVSSLARFDWTGQQVARLLRTMRPANPCCGLQDKWSSFFKSCYAERKHAFLPDHVHETVSRQSVSCAVGMCPCSC